LKPSSYARLRSRLWVRRNLNPIAERGSRLLAPTAWLQGREIVYQSLVHRDLDRLEINEPFYPLRSSATYSYLYLLLRAAQELGELRILELGAGQSTVLLDRLAEKFPLQCTTLEHDADWVDRIGGRVRQRVLHAPLVARTIHGHTSDVYDSGVLEQGQRFNVILVDGPRSSRRRSRWGALEFVQNWLEPEFLILFDDAERRGELQTIGSALQMLDARDCRYGSQLTRSINSQFLIATEGFQAALYF
jgi:predicted O-methyltransferase YrrM